MKPASLAYNPISRSELPSPALPPFASASSHDSVSAPLPSWRRRPWSCTRPGKTATVRG